MELLHLKSFDFKLGNTRKTILCHFCANLILKCIKYDYGVVYDYDLWKYDLLLKQEKSFGETEAAFTILSYLHHQDTETSANFVDEFFRKWLRWCILLSSPLLSSPLLFEMIYYRKKVVVCGSFLFRVLGNHNKFVLDDREASVDGTICSDIWWR